LAQAEDLKIEFLMFWDVAAFGSPPVSVCFAPRH